MVQEVITIYIYFKYVLRNSVLFRGGWSLQKCLGLVDVTASPQACAMAHSIDCTVIMVPSMPVGLTGAAEAPCCQDSHHQAKAFLVAELGKHFKTDCAGIFYSNL